MAWHYIPLGKPTQNAFIECLTVSLAQAVNEIPFLADYPHS